MSDSGFDSQATPAAALATLRQHPVLQVLKQLADHRECHLVGGALRDAILGVPSVDLDVIVAGRGQTLAQALADHYSSRVIDLGGDRFASYRVYAAGSRLDLWDRGRKSLESDLERRDLTIHSFALDLEGGSILDPFGGLEDLAGKKLRMTTPTSFSSDPLRVLRLCRFATQLSGFQIDSATLEQATSDSSSLRRVASERIRSEIELSLAHPRAGIAPVLWVEIGIFPDALLDRSITTETRHQLRSELIRAFSAFDQAVGVLPSPGGLTAARIALTLAALESTTGTTPSVITADDLRRRGYLTRDRYRRMTRILTAPSIPDELPDQRWYLHTLGDLWTGAAAFSSAATVFDPVATSTREFVSHRLAHLTQLARRERQSIFDPPKLLTGRDLTNELGLEPGPDLGHILQAIRRRQVEGSLADRQQALEFARRLISDQP